MTDLLPIDQSTISHEGFSLEEKDKSQISYLCSPCYLQTPKANDSSKDTFLPKAQSRGQDHLREMQEQLYRIFHS
jgi:hypothetical protein